MAAAVDPPSVLVAHRGLSGAAQVKYGLPEHSLAAYNFVMRQGAPVIDFDVQWTSDGKLVIMHDSTLDRTTNKTGKVSSRTLDYIKAAYLELPRDLDGNGDDDNTTYHPPSLNQALDYVKNRNTTTGVPVKITLETKGAWTLDRMKRLREVVYGKGLINRVILHSFDDQEVKWAKTAGFPLRGLVVSASDPLPSAATVKSYASYIFTDIAVLTPAKAAEYQDVGLVVAVGTLDDQGEYDKALQTGANIWIVNDYPEAKQALEDAA